MITHRSRYSLTLDAAEMQHVLLEGFSPSIASTVHGYSLETIEAIEGADGNLSRFVVTFARNATPWA